MKSTPGWILIALAVLPLACDDGQPGPLMGPDPAPATGRSTARIETCDARYISRRGATITVLPTGANDTRNLQCAFDAARKGDVVQLTAADYHTAQIAVVRFQGKFTGMGADRTIIRNLPDLVVSAKDLTNETPGPDHTFPSLFSFGESDLTVSALAIKIVGEAPTTGWSIFGLDLRELANAITVYGRTGNVRVSDVLVEGQKVPSNISGTNLINGVYVEGNFGGNPDALSGSFRVEHSAFKDVSDPMPYTVVDGFKAAFHHVTVTGADALSAGDLRNATVEYAHNIVESALGIFLFNLGVLDYGVQSSSIVIKNNRFSGGYGAYFDATFGSDVRCLLVGNNIKATENGLFLGSGASVCRVVSGGAWGGNGHERAPANHLVPLWTRP